MTTGRMGVWFLIVLWLLIEAFPMVTDAGDSNPDNSSALNASRLVERIDRLDNRVTELEAQVVTLKREKLEAQENLKRQRNADSALESQTADRTSSPIEHSSKSEELDPRDEQPRHDLISSFGVRAGYQGFPFGQREGGFFYGLFLDHLLVGQSEGMPGGDLDLELGAAVARSGNDDVIVNSRVVGEPTKVEFRQRMISIWPGLKYRYDRWQSYGLSPYLIGGPGVWVDIIETPPLVGGLQFPTDELRGRKLPTTAGASLFEGAQGGAGFEYSLARLGHPIFERMKLGFDYRYAAWTTGQRFSTYSLLLSYRD